MATAVRRKPAVPKPKVSSPRLKNYLDATKHDPILLGVIDRHIQLKVPDRDPTVIHPSEMAMRSWCHRATWLRLTGVKPAKPPAVERLASNLVYAEGHTIHDKWQKWLTDIGCIWGAWKCGICDEITMGWADAIGAVCPALAGTKHERPHQWHYLEVPLAEPSLRIGGRADGVINPSGDEAVLLEIKSVGPGTIRHLDLLADEEADELSSDRFSKITRPLASHFLQTQLYLRLLPMYRSEIGPISRAVVLYEHKSDQQVREFVVTRNDRWTDPLLDAAADIVWAIDAGVEVKCNKKSTGCESCLAYVEE